MPVKESSPKKKQKKNEEKLSRYEIEELMGTNRRIHKRGRGGALRQKGENGTMDEKKIQSDVINELRNYRALKVWMENKLEQETVGVTKLFETANKCQKAEEEDELKVKQIDRALQNSLDAMERKIIEQKYLSSIETNDIQIYLELGLKKGKFYEKKRSALLSIAKSLGIV